MTHFYFSRQLIICPQKYFLMIVLIKNYALITSSFYDNEATFDANSYRLQVLLLKQLQYVNNFYKKFLFNSE
jgi:hypothetical protein